MNFDARYLIRWGIPGWVFIISIGLYLALIEMSSFIDILNYIIGNAPNLLATTTLLLIIGIPIGYILNQIHHVWIWVIRVKWIDYFEMEYDIYKCIYKAENEVEVKQLKYRYRYLLNRVHELGGLLIALFLPFTIIGVYHLINRTESLTITIYTLILGILSFIIFLSRNYYRKNLDVFIKCLYKSDYDSIIHPNTIKVRNGKIYKCFIKFKSIFNLS